MRYCRMILFAVTMLMYSSCDYFNDSPVHLVGKTYLLSLDGGNRKSLYYKTGEGEYSMVDASGTVTTALANDSLIYLKCDLQPNPAWHLVKHEKGEKIFSIKNIDSLDFARFERSGDFKYSYYSK
jgi:hypothetical protein